MTCNINGSLYMIGNSFKAIRSAIISGLASKSIWVEGKLSNSASEYSNCFRSNLRAFSRRSMVVSQAFADPSSFKESRKRQRAGKFPAPDPPLSPCHQQSNTRSGTASCCRPRPGFQIFFVYLPTQSSDMTQYKLPIFRYTDPLGGLIVSPQWDKCGHLL